MEEISEKGGFLRQTVKGVAAAIIITLVGVLVFAFVLDISGLGEGIVKPINQVIKLLSVFGGCLFAVKGEKGFLKGATIGIISSAASALLFGLIAGGIGSVAGVAIDLICSLVMGAISGAISIKLPIGKAN